MLTAYLLTLGWDRISNIKTTRKEFSRVMTDKEKLESEEQQKENMKETTDSLEEQEYRVKDAERQDEQSVEQQELNHSQSDDSNPATSLTSGRKRTSTLWTVVSIVLAIALVIVLIKPPFQNNNEPIATVNGVNIEKDKLYDALVAAGGTQTLDTMIMDELIQQEFDKAGIKITQADYDKELAMLKKSFPSEEEFDAALQQSGMTLDDLKEQMEPQVKIRKLLEPKVSITDEQVKQFFDDNKASLDTPEQVRASHILVATKEEAEAIQKELKEGAEFTQLAKEKSLDPESKEMGGDLNFFSRGQKEKTFEDAAFSQKQDELGIVQTSNGFHVLKVTDRKDAYTAIFDDEKAEIRDQLVSQKISEMSTKWIEDLKANSKITNTLLKEPTDDESSEEETTLNVKE